MEKTDFGTCWLNWHFVYLCVFQKTSVVVEYLEHLSPKMSLSRSIQSLSSWEDRAVSKIRKHVCVVSNCSHIYLKVIQTKQSTYHMYNSFSALGETAGLTEHVSGCTNLASLCCSYLPRGAVSEEWTDRSAAPDAWAPQQWWGPWTGHWTVHCSWLRQLAQITAERTAGTTAHR